VKNIFRFLTKRTNSKDTRVKNLRYPIKKYSFTNPYTFAERTAAATGDDDQDEDDGSSSSEPEEDDDLSTAGGFDELLNRANIELGGAIRTEQRRTETGTRLYLFTLIDSL
jgi:hypothetical protein